MVGGMVPGGSILSSAKSDSGAGVGPPADDPGAGQSKTSDPYWKMDHEQVADVQGEASRMAINEKGLPRHKSTK